MNCVLCDLEKLKESHVYFEDNQIIIVDDIKLYDFNRRFMVIIKRHTDEPLGSEIEHAITKLCEIAKTEFKNQDWVFHDKKETFPNHWHAHAAWGKM